MKVFSIAKERQEKTTDSELILLAYQKWGHDCPQFLIGGFCFVIKDHQRMSYSVPGIRSGKEPCTIMMPKIFCFFHADEAFEAIQDRYRVKWEMDYRLSCMEQIIHETECTETVYQQINQLPPAFGCALIIMASLKNNTGIRLRILKTIILKQMKNMKKFPQSILRSCFLPTAVYWWNWHQDERGAGFRSIACVASAMLAEKNKKRMRLAPSNGRIRWKARQEFTLFDESEDIQAIVDFPAILNQSYWEVKEAFVTDVDQNIAILEQPYKIFQNIFGWIRFMEKSRSERLQGCFYPVHMGTIQSLTVSLTSMPKHYLIEAK